MRGGVDGDLLAGAFATLHRTYGIGPATGALVLAAAMGASGEALDGHLATIEEHQMQRLLPEVLGRIIYLALAAHPEPGIVDVERWPEGKPTRTREDVVGTIRYMAEHAEDLEWAADRLDAESREVLTQRLVYLTLDHERAHVGPSSDELERLSTLARTELRTADFVRGLGYTDAVNQRDFLFSHRFDLRPIGFPITLETSMFGAQATYQLQQYWAPNHPDARPRAGDVVVDGGGYLGETALWFAHVVGKTGGVLTFELEKGALSVLRENLEANPELASRIAIDEHALWDEPGHELPILVSGPGTTVMAETPEAGDEAIRPSSSSSRRCPSTRSSRRASSSAWTSSSSTSRARNPRR